MAASVSARATVRPRHAGGARPDPPYARRAVALRPERADTGRPCRLPGEGGPEEPFAPKGDKARASALGRLRGGVPGPAGPDRRAAAAPVAGRRRARPGPLFGLPLLQVRAAQGRSRLSADDWGEALTHEAMVARPGACARSTASARSSSRVASSSPTFEIETLRALRRAFPDAPLRIDPNGGWSVETTRRVMPQLRSRDCSSILRTPAGRSRRWARSRASRRCRSPPTW